MMKTPIKEKVLDFTKYHGICGDPLVYIMEEIRSLGKPCRLTVIYEDYEEMQEIAKILEEMNIKIIDLAKQGEKTVLKIEAS